MTGATSRKIFLIVFAAVEVATALGLLILPPVLFAKLLGLHSVPVDTIFVGRVAGAALLALGVASWMAKSDAPNPAQFGLLIGILIYNTTASMLLIYAGLALKMIGVVLWPAVAIHALLMVWGLGCLLPYRIASN